MVNARPVFVDTDIETFQIDAKKIAAAITPQTRLILPVHLGGAVADMDTIMALSTDRHIPVLEDACQSHLAQWKGRHVGSLGKAGCFSFQASKNLNSGEGGAIISNDPALVEKAFAFHNNGRPGSGSDFAYRHTGLNLRLTEFQASLLLAQMTRLESQASQRESNAAYLTKALAEIPGITPAKMYPGVTRNAYHLYMFRYDPASFADFTGVLLDLGGGKRIAHALDDKKAVILRNPGLLTVGHSVDEAVWWFITMERSCQAQLLAEAAGTPILIDPPAAELTAEQVGSHLSGYFSFQPLYDKITREQPDLFE